MTYLGRRRGRVAVISVAAALIAGACSGGSGDPENALGADTGVVSYGAEDASPVTIAEVADEFSALPLAIWANAGAKVSYTDNRFDVVDFGAEASDGNDDAWAFNKAIAAAVQAGGGVVTVPDGTFLLQETVRLDSNVILRGNGRSTRLELDLQDQSGFGIAAAGTADDAWSDLEADLAAGAESIDLPFEPSTRLVELEQDNTEQILTKPEWDVTWGEASEGEMIVVDGGRLESALVSSYSRTRNARAREVQPVENVGVEDLTIIRLDEGYGHTISFRYALNAWVNNVVSTRTSFAHVGIEQTARCTVSDSILHDATDFGDGGRAYGVSLARHTTGCAVVNNTLYDLRHALIIQLGASGNVFAYNHARGSAGYEDRRPRADISLHGHWPQRNLFEGNIVDRIEIADWWGPAGPQNTFLRNCVLDHVILLDFSEEQLFAGNVFGVSEITIDPSVQVATFIANEGDSAPDSGSDSSLPVSLWRNDAPQFLGGQWPPIDPSQGSPSCDLPASGRSPLGNR